MEGVNCTVTGRGMLSRPPGLCAVVRGGGGVPGSEDNGLVVVWAGSLWAGLVLRGGSPPPLPRGGAEAKFLAPKAPETIVLPSAVHLEERLTVSQSVS